MTLVTSASHGLTDRLPNLEDGNVHDLYVDCLDVLDRLGPLTPAPRAGTVHRLTVSVADQVLVVPDDARDVVDGLSSYGS